MRTTFQLAFLAVALKCRALGQLYLLTGSPTPGDTRDFVSSIFKIDNGGAVKEVERVASGVESIAVSHDLGRAVLLPKDRTSPVSVVDLQNASIVKRCVLPQTSDASFLFSWVAEVPGRGQVFEWFLFRTIDETWARGMSLDPSRSCSESFADVTPSEFRFGLSDGAAGVAGIGALEASVGFARDGRLEVGFGRALVDLGIDRLPEEMRKDLSFTEMVCNNSRSLVVKAAGDAHERARFLMFKKNDRTWHELPVPGDASNLQGFGRYISVVEAHTKKAIAAQWKRGYNIEVNKDVRERELSPGAAEWRKADGRMGPDMEESFAEALAVFPGKLHLYNIDSGKLFSLETKQGDSEVLLVEDDTFYYRVSDRLYSAPISDKGIGAAKLLASDESIRDAHWAFIKH